MGKLKDIDATRLVTASAEEVWRLVGDRSTWPDWSPLGSFEPVTNGSPEPSGVGCVNRYKTGRITVTEEIVEYVPNRRISYVVLSGMPLKNYRADIDLTPTSDGTQVRFHSTFRPRYPGTGWMYRFGLQKFCERMLAGLADQFVSASGGVRASS